MADHVRTGAPLARALWLHYPADAVVRLACHFSLVSSKLSYAPCPPDWDRNNHFRPHCKAASIVDQLLLGSDVLLAPVFAANATSRTVPPPRIRHGLTTGVSPARKLDPSVERPRD